MRRTTKIDKQKKSLFSMNKKGFVWADLVGAFQRAVSWFLDTVPRPIKLLMFLLFLLGFVSIFGFLLNSSGNFCDTNGNLYETGFFSLGTNLELLSSMPSYEDLNKVELGITETTFTIFSKCETFIVDGFYYENGEKIYIENGTRNYYDGGYCTDCETRLIISNLTLASTESCITDGYTIPYEDKNWLKKYACGRQGCEPPVNYYYSFEDDSYVCEDNDICGNMTIGQNWNDLLKSVGAKITPATTFTDRNYRNAVAVSCDVGDLQPQFKFFGIKVFDYKLWVGIYLLLGLIWIVYKIKYKS